MIRESPIWAVVGVRISEYVEEREERRLGLPIL